MSFSLPTGVGFVAFWTQRFLTNMSPNYTHSHRTDRLCLWNTTSQLSTTQPPESGTAPPRDSEELREQKNHVTWTSPQ